jgi:hypothetical protein
MQVRPLFDARCTIGTWKSILSDAFSKDDQQVKEILQRMEANTDKNNFTSLSSIDADAVAQLFSSRSIEIGPLQDFSGIQGCKVDNKSTYATLRSKGNADESNQHLRRLIRVIDNEQVELLDTTVNQPDGKIDVYKLNDLRNESSLGFTFVWMEKHTDN